jgi:hypothetical protein
MRYDNAIEIKYNKHESKFSINLMLKDGFEKKKSIKKTIKKITRVIRKNKTKL